MPIDANKIGCSRQPLQQQQMSNALGLNMFGEPSIPHSFNRLSKGLFLDHAGQPIAIKLAQAITD